MGAPATDSTGTGATETGAIVHLRNVSFSYGGSSHKKSGHSPRGDNLALKDINVAISPGSWVSLIGPNGCGKSTLLHCMAGLNHCEGDIEVAGLDPRRTSRRKLARRIALMPQQPVIPEGMRIGDYVSLGRAPYRGRGEEVVTDVLHRLGLEDYVRRLLTDVSGGELQRVVLARALAQQPTVLLLDEPTSALDIGKAQQVMELVDSIRDGSQLTVVAALHDLTLAAQYSDELVFLNHGSVVKHGRPDAVLTDQLVSEVYFASVSVVATESGPAVLPRRDRQQFASGRRDNADS